MRPGAALALIVLSGLAARPGAAGSVKPPRLVVGIVSGADELDVSSSSGAVSLREGRERSETTVRGPFRLAARETPEPAPPPERWFVKVREDEDRERAVLVAEALSPTVRAPVRVRERDGRHVVEVGPEADAAEARRIVQLLRSAGFPDPQLRREQGPAPDRASRLVRVDPDWSVRPVEPELVVLRAENSGGLVSVNGTSHRGEVQVSVDATGRLRATVALELEDYVRGVVPQELGPSSFPELEALAAQAVASRSWVLTQLGRHAAEGFDVCAGPHCQVYGGASAEVELSDRAVRDTAGRVLAHGGRPAVAYFSSTCGGRTEAVQDVFGGEPLPYLQGVSCSPETVAFTRLTGRALTAGWTRVDGTDAGDVLARLLALRVIDEAEARRGGFERPARDDESAAWLRSAAEVLGRRLDERAMGSFEVGRATDLVRSFVAALGWSERARLLHPTDLAAAQRFWELERVSGDDLVAALLALRGGLIPEGLTPDWAEGRPSRGNVLEVVDRWLEAEGAYEVAPVRFLGPVEGGLRVRRGDDDLVLELVAEPWLLSGRKGGRAAVRPVLELKLADKLFALGPPGGPARLLRLEEDLDGAAFDRTSVYSWWRRRIPVETLAARARERLGIRDLRDVSVKRLGSGGRIAALELVGADGRSRLVEGFAARTLLGLPDSRATLALERGGGGRLRAVLATGRGWGHGVGLCQFGAYGMAMAGRSRDEILRHYFPGAELTTVDRLEEVAPPL